MPRKGVRKLEREDEVRSLFIPEIRELGEGTEKESHIQGYALKFDEISEDMGFREIIARGALDNADMSDVVLNFNHDMNMILARNNKNEGLGSLKLTIDERGLFFDAVPTKTTYAKDLIENMRSGIVGKCSFRFRINWNDSEAQSWDWDDGKRGFDLRTIHKIEKIIDCSVQVRPAYEGTSSTVYERGKESYTKEIEKAKSEEIRQLEEEFIRIELI